MNGTDFLTILIVGFIVGLIILCIVDIIKTNRKLRENEKRLDELTDEYVERRR